MELERAHVAETRVKRCRFIACAGKACTAADAKSFISMVSEDDATHNCWAFRIDENTYRYSDDGEPSGTAGKPIYTAICNSGIVQVVVVVTRFFGGTKLGAGGLIRAYSNATSNCLEQAPKRAHVQRVDLVVRVGWEHVGAAQSVVEKTERLDTVYDSEGCTIYVRVDEEELGIFKRQIRDACSGAVCVELAQAEK